MQAARRPMPARNPRSRRRKRRTLAAPVARSPHRARPTRAACSVYGSQLRSCCACDRAVLSGAGAARRRKQIEDICDCRVTSGWLAPHDPRDFMRESAGASLPLRACAATSFALVATLGTYATASGSARLGAALAAGLLSIGPALLFAALVLGGARAVGGVRALAPITARWSLARFVDRAPDAPRAPVI